MEVATSCSPFFWEVLSLISYLLALLEQNTKCLFIPPFTFLTDQSKPFKAVIQGMLKESCVLSNS